MASLTWSGSSERRRVTWCAVAGTVVASALAFALAWQLVVLIGWIVTASTLLSGIWIEIGRLDATRTAQVATREDDSRNAARAMLLASSVISLIAILVALHRASRAAFALEVALTVAALLAVVLSWLLVHSVFVLRYAHLYYGGDDPASGVDFPGGAEPSYRDFAYLAFTVGMTFQVSDTAITSRAVRATVLRHSLLSYLFSIAIIAVMINVLAGLIT